jgi:formylglycine-generating enzyme
MKRQLLAVLVGVLAVVNFTSADTIRGINIDFVTIGHAGNAGDTQVESDGTTGYGAVGYDYRISKYEITNAQWNIFTATVGAPTGNDIGMFGSSNIYCYSSSFTGAQQPTNNVNWYEAAQFCNYLTSGDKSKGAYQFSGSNVNPGTLQGVDRKAAQTTYGTIYVIPTEDEWYKAAFFKPDGSGYSLYANGTNTAPIAGVQSNYNSVLSQPWNVGTGTMEQNGTYDMMGNLCEWNETSIYNYGCRGIRDGTYDSWPSDDGCITSYLRNYYYPWGEASQQGFRIACIPEPATLLLLGLGGMLIKRRGNH